MLSARLIELARNAGALSVLPAAFASAAAIQLLAGEPAQANWLVQRAEAIARATGQVPEPGGPLMLAAWEGREREAGRLIATITTEMTTPGEGQWLTTAAWAAAVLHNGLSRYHEALAVAEQASTSAGGLGPATWSLAELIEAAARTGQPGRAAAAMERLSEATCAAGTDWALGIQMRCRALLSEGEAAERAYVEAIGRLGCTQVRVELARAYRRTASGCAGRNAGRTRASSSGPPTRCWPRCEWRGLPNAPGSSCWLPARRSGNAARRRPVS